LLTLYSIGVSLVAARYSFWRFSKIYCFKSSLYAISLSKRYLFEAACLPLVKPSRVLEYAYTLARSALLLYI
jgi:hypothetical protein